MGIYNTISESIVDKLSQIFDQDIIIDQEVMQDYGHDHTEDLMSLPQLVVKPKTVEQVQELMKMANLHNFPVTPQGARTGLSGGAIPVHRGVVLSMEKMNTVVELDLKNHQVTVEPGLINQELQQILEPHGLFYPPDPSSWGSCTIGGNVATNAGGPRAVKYGVTSAYVLNLEVVLPDGSVIWTGANTLKNSTGYNLTQLIVGSEGTLGIVTKVVLKLLPKPSREMTLLVPFLRMNEAAESVNKIITEGIDPVALEFMEKEAVALGLEFIGDSSVQMDTKAEAYLLIELNGEAMDSIMQRAEKLVGLLEDCEIGDIQVAEAQNEKDQLWKVRRVIGEAVKSRSVYKEEDTVVPRYALPDLVQKVKQLSKSYGFQSVCYGHAGDGNLHVNILKGDLTDDQWNETIKEAIRELFMYCKQLGGTISGEHGIGLVQKEYLPLVFSDTQIYLHKLIKKTFDPNSILNPDKIV